MEIKATLQKPYVEIQRIEFVIEQNHKNGYEIRETEVALEAWGYTEEEKKQQERERKDQMTLTPADVWRALYKAKQMRAKDLLELIETKMTGIDINLVEIEFGASSFYRGAQLGSGRLFDVIGALLGYTSEDMDYLFEHKELPAKEQKAEETEAEETEAE